MSFSGGGGSGAAATAIITIPSGYTTGSVSSITVTNIGSGYTSAPTVTLTGGSGTGAAATAYADGGVMSTDFNTNTPFLPNSIISKKFILLTFPLTVRGTRDGTDPEDNPTNDPITDILYGGGSGARVDRFLVTNDDRRLFEIGLFSYKKTSYFQTKYAVVTNKRTWPYYFTYGSTGLQNGIKTTDGSDDMLGPIDRRTFSAYIDDSPAKWKDATAKELKRFQVTDFRDPCHPQFVYPESQPFNITLDPGEGTLLSFTPVFGDPPISCANDGGWQPAVIINNGRHISSRELSTSSQDYQMTYEKQGGIAVCYPAEGLIAGDSSNALRHLGTPVDSLIDSSANCHDPAISAHRESPTQFAVVYSMDSTGTGSHPDSTSVIFRYTNDGTPYSYSPRIVLDKFKTPLSTYTRATPAITPAKTGCGKWWCSWRNPDVGGKIDLLDISGNIISSKVFSAGDPASTRFISITSHLFRDSILTHPESDTCYMAFEEGPRPSASIYYLEAFCSSSGIDTTGLKDVCVGLPNCENHYPCIAMSPRGRVTITWDAISERYTWTDSVYTQHRTHSVDVRTRYRDNVWTRYTTFKAFDVPLASGDIDTLSSYPCVAISSFIQYDSTKWSDDYRLVWHSPFEEQAHIAHLGFIEGRWSPIFQSTTMPDVSLYPAIAVRTLYDGILEPVMYTHPTYAQDTIYSTNITVYDMPLSSQLLTLILQKQFIAKPAGALCGTRVVGDVGQILIKRDTAILVVNWIPGDTIYIDSVVHQVYAWNDSTVHSEQFLLYPSDTLEYGRYFKVGNYHPGDTTLLQPYLVGPNDYIKMTVKLRNALNGSLISILDSCKLYSGGFMQSGNLTDSGLSKTGIISPLGVPVYLTFEASRGNSSNSFQISASDCYDDDPFKVDESLAPLGDTSYKISQPGSPKPAAFVSGITMMVRPNPFRTQTEIELDVPSEVLLNVTVFDLLGKHITTLYNNYSVSSHHDFILDSKQLTPGMYLSGFKQVIRLFRGRLNW